ncbi:hypothetical protein AMTRI_Chr02g212240 [Amborella trichopoda]|uniref:CSC1-like protein ERD4 n=1 Tax=Amborella trichopoda TaxID=13333 RepID=W1NQI7_AMBTC|nr:CSC1-like protein ERD4 [Amborella trichopoda]ERM99166.1 hypothetical protein AMTR_s00092p00051600 [Amborella trichopoda]|eukprot:XP_006836313.1 CSC1-like protein ERD4 [Amborella trichopoda]
MDFSSFITSLLTSFLIFVVLILIFTWLSRKPANDVIYYPNRILKGLDPMNGHRTRNPFSWIKEAISSSEENIIDMAGVDTAVYFVFLRTVLGILVISGILLLPILLPVAVTDINTTLTKETNSNGTFNNLDKLAIGNVQNKSPRLWAFLLATYWVSFITFFMLWKAYKHVLELRSSAQSRSDVARPEQFTVLVRDIPPVPHGQSRKEQVDAYFKRLHPETFHKSLVITDNKEVNKKFQKLEGYRKKLAHAEAVYAESKTASNPEGTRPSCKTGFLGLIGSKVDTINFCNENIKELVSELEREQNGTIKDKQQAAALIVFCSRPAATLASQTVHSPTVDSWTVMPAPEPRQLLWSNLPIPFYQRQIRQYIVYGIVFLTVCFYTIPVGFFSAFTTLENLSKYLPFLKAIVDLVEIKTVLEAFLPQLALLVFMALLPMFLMMLSKAEGIPSESHAVRAASGKYFYFTIFTVFIGFTLGGSLFDNLKNVGKHPDQIVTMLGDSVPKVAMYFITFVALKFFVGYGLELSRLVPLIIYHLKRKYLCKTEEELKEAWAPGSMGYATRVPNDMLIVTLSLCYSVISPLIIPFGVLYFGFGWLVLRNQALKVFVPSYESYGRMWPHMHTRIVAALFVFQLTMIGYFGTKAFVYTPLLIPLPFLSVIFAFVCQKRFYQSFAVNPLEVACQSLKEAPNLDSIAEAYVPPCLSSVKHDGTEPV